MTFFKMIKIKKLGQSQDALIKPLFIFLLFFCFFVLQNFKNSNIAFTVVFCNFEIPLIHRKCTGYVQMINLRISRQQARTKKVGLMLKALQLIGCKEIPVHLHLMKIAYLLKKNNSLEIQQAYLVCWVNKSLT